MERSKPSKRKMLSAILVGGFGGMTPKLIELIPRFFQNDLPEVGYYYGLALLAVFGIVAVLVYRELDLKRALIIGAGAPAIIASLTATAVAPTETVLRHPPAFNMKVAYAQSTSELRQPMNLRIVVEKNESPFQLNALWIRAGKTTLKYRVNGNTVLTNVPRGTELLRIDFPIDARGLVVKTRALDPSRTITIRISKALSSQDFWQAFGGAKVPSYRIEHVPED